MLISQSVCLFLPMMFRLLSAIFFRQLPLDGDTYVILHRRITLVCAPRGCALVCVPPVAAPWCVFPPAAAPWCVCSPRLRPGVCAPHGCALGGSSGDHHRYERVSIGPHLGSCWFCFSYPYRFFDASCSPV